MRHATIPPDDLPDIEPATLIWLRAQMGLSEKKMSQLFGVRWRDLERGIDKLHGCVKLKRALHITIKGIPYVKQQRSNPDWTL